jgi:pimeloyl-ACP methyl ester carboxylesterase
VSNDFDKTQRTAPTAIELPLPWGQTLRGLHWPGNGNPILLLHEPDADLDAWGALPPTLAAALDAAVFAYDLPGHGLSDDPWQPDRLPDVLRLASHHISAGHPLAMLAAGQTATFALQHAPALPLLGLVCLSPAEPTAPPPRSPTIPKLFFAGSLAADDLARARRLAATCAGWSIVTAIPLAAQGTNLLPTTWHARITEQTVAFLRDCLHLPARSR